MPNITTYNGPQGAIRPSNLPETAYQLEGRRAGSIGNERAAMLRQGGALAERTANLQAHVAEGIGKEISSIGEMVDRHEGQQEILAGIPRLAELSNQLDLGYQQTVANSDPFDTEVSKRFREQTAPIFSDFAESFSTPSGKAWATTHVAQLQTAFYRTTLAQDMTRAGEMAKLGITQATNTLANQVARNPISMDGALALVDGSVKSLAEHTPKLDQEALKQHMSREIVHSGIVGTIDQNPDAGVALINSGKYDKFVSGEDRKTLLQYAQAKTHFNQAQEQHNEATAKKQDLLDFKAALGNVYTTMLAKDANGTPTGDLLVPPDFGTQLLKLNQMPGYKQEPTAIEALIGAANRIREQNLSGRLDTTDPTIRDSFNARMFANENPLTIEEVDRAKASGVLSNSDYTHYRQAVGDADKLAKANPEAKQQINEQLTLARSIINHPSSFLPAGTAAGAAASAEYLRWARPFVSQQLAAGTPLPQILDALMAPDRLKPYQDRAASGSGALSGIQGQIAPSGPRPPLADILGPR